MGHLTTDIASIYETYYSEPYKVSAEHNAGNNRDPLYGSNVSLTATDIVARRNVGGLNIPVMLPVRLEVEAVNGQAITIDCCTIRVVGKRTIVRTPVSGRRGTVKEEYQIGDWQFTIKGVLIGDRRGFPDSQITVLKEIYESQKPVKLLNALSDLFLDAGKYVAIESLEFGEVEGKSIRHRPFVMVCESDFVEDLNLSANV